jgi:ubiquitin-like protein Pup
MAERERIQKSSRSESDPEPGLEAPEASRSGERLKAELDDLLDEIDEVLETNAEEFVNSYIQKGGQ